MSNAISSIKSFLKETWDNIREEVKSAWDSIVEEVLEEVFSWFGIEDEDIVIVQKVSSPVFSTDTTDMRKNAADKAVIASTKDDRGFYSHYKENLGASRTQIRAYYNYGKSGNYAPGVPELNIHSQFLDNGDVKSAVDTEFGGNNTIVSARTSIPQAYAYYQNAMQSPSPEAYDPDTNQLTYVDQWGVNRSWDYNNATENVLDITIHISRVVDRTYVWMYGPETVTEGDTVEFQLYLNRQVPAGKTLPVNITYSGTAVDGTDFTAVASVTFLASTDYIPLNVNTLEVAGVQGARTLTATISSVDNSGDAFDYVEIHANDAVTVNIIDDDTKILTMPGALVGEGVGNAVIPVTLNQAAAGAFTVDYTFTDITATGIVGGGVGSDYDSTTGTLNFAGTNGEVQNITVPITSDVVDDDLEEFQINLTNCSDGTITLTNTKVKILDRTDDTAQDQTTDSTTFSKPLFTVTGPYLIVHFHPALQPNNGQIWHYELALGTYPDIESQIDDLFNLDMLPIAILRHNQVTMTTSDPDYAATRALLAMLEVRLDETLESLEENPDIANVDDAYFTFAISPKDGLGQRSVSKILWLVFEFIHVTKGLVSPVEQYSANGQEGDIKNSVVWNKFDHNVDVSGTATVEGEYIHALINVPNGNLDEEGNPITGSNNGLQIRYQKDASTYDELVIHNLNMMSAVEYADHHKIAFNTLDDDELTIPLSYFIFDQLSDEETLEAYRYMFRFEVTAGQVIHVEWYKTAAFWTLFQIVLIVITVITGGLTSPLLFLQNLLITYLSFEIAAYIAEKTGNEELGAVVGTAFAVYSMYTFNPDFAALTFGDQLTFGSLNFINGLTASYEATNAIRAEEVKAEMAEIDKKLDPGREAAKLAKEREERTKFFVSLRDYETQYYTAIQSLYDGFDQSTRYDSLIADSFDDFYKLIS